MTLDFTKAESRLKGRGFSSEVRIVADTRDMPEEEWLEHRKKGFGGSDAAKLLGHSRFGTAMGTWGDKTGMKERGESNESMELGHFFEDPIAKLYKERTGRTVERVNALLSNPNDAPNLLANLDRITKDEEGEWGVLEIKNLNGNWKDEDILAEYTPQVTQYMGITGLKWAVLFGTKGGTSTFMFEIRWDDVAQDFSVLVDRAARMKICVDTMVPPSLSSEEWSNQAGEKWLKDADVTRDGTNDRQDVVLDGIKKFSMETLVALKEEVKEKNKEIKALQSTIVDGMDFPAVIHAGELKATWRYQAEGLTTDTKKLKEDYPKVFDAVQKTKKGFWVFR